MKEVMNLREKLVGVATRLIDRHGLAEFSWRAVAKTAGVSHGAPSRHFADKTMLLEAVAERGFNELKNMCVQTRQRYPDDPRAQLQAVSRGYLQYALHHPGVLHLLAGGVLPWPAVGEELRAAGQATFISFMEIIEQGQAQGLFRVDKSAKTPDHETTINMAYAAWCTVHGLALFVSEGPLKSLRDYPDRLEDVISSLLETLLLGIQTRR